MKDLKTVLKTALASKNLDQKKLAEPLGLTQQAVSDWGRSGKIPEKHWDYVREVLGHASPDMTMRIYQHTSTGLRRDAISRIGNVLPTLP